MQRDGRFVSIEDGIREHSPIPNEVLLYILSFISPKDLITVSLVCKQLHLLANDPILWRKIATDYSDDFVFALRVNAEINAATKFLRRPTQPRNNSEAEFRRFISEWREIIKELTLSDDEKKALQSRVATHRILVAGDIVVKTLNNPVDNSLTIIYNSRILGCLRNITRLTPLSMIIYYFSTRSSPSHRRGELLSQTTASALIEAATERDSMFKFRYFLSFLPFAFTSIAAGIFIQYISWRNIQRVLHDYRQQTLPTLDTDNPPAWRKYIAFKSIQLTETFIATGGFLLLYKILFNLTNVSAAEYITVDDPSIGRCYRLSNVPNDLSDGNFKFDGYFADQHHGDYAANEMLFRLLYVPCLFTITYALPKYAKWAIWIGKNLLHAADAGYKLAERSGQSMWNFFSSSQQEDDQSESDDEYGDYYEQIDAQYGCKKD